MNAEELPIFGHYEVLADTAASAPRPKTGTLRPASKNSKKRIPPGIRTP
jgi:hypothetical protein